MANKKPKKQKPIFVDRENSGPMLTNKQYEKIKTLESKQKNASKNI
mgnify:CR=1 FL=1